MGHLSLVLNLQHVIGDFLTKKMNIWLLLVLLSSNYIKTNWAEPKITPSVIAAALKGDSLWLNCSDIRPSSSLHWIRISGGSLIPEYIYDPWSGLSADYRLGGRHSVDSNISIGAYDLKIQNISIDDAGIYVCMDNDGNREQVQLIVLDSSPKCLSNISLNNVLVENDCNLEPDYIKLICSVAYHGNQHPDLEWRNSANFEVRNSSVVTISSSKNMITQSLIVRASSRLNGTNFMCRVAGVPRYGCETEDISTVYFYNSYRHMTMSKNNDDNVSCTANTSQMCDYRWRVEIPESPGNPVEFPQQTINLKTIILEKELEFESLCCYAECKIRGNRCKSTPVNLTVKVDDCKEETGSDNSMSILVIIIIVVPVAGIALVSVIVYCGMHGRKWIAWLRERKHKFKNFDLDESEQLKSGGHKLLDHDDIHCVGTINVMATGKLAGIALCGNEIYVVAFESNRVDIFSDEPPFQRRDEIEIIGLQKPSDMTGFNKSIFISDWGKRCLWKVQTTGKEFVRFDTIGVPGGLSTTSKNELVVVMLRDHNRFYVDIFRLSDVFPINSIPLPKGINVISNAVQMSNGNFIVSYKEASSEGTNLIGEFSSQGGSFHRTFGNMQESHLFTYIVLGENDSVFICDSLAKRIYRKNSETYDLQMLPFEEKNHNSRNNSCETLKIGPSCLCYAREKRRLVVGYGKCLRIFSLPIQSI